MNIGPYIWVYLNKDQQTFHRPKQTRHLAKYISIATDPSPNFTRR
jgi:hypothetical protein